MGLKRALAGLALAAVSVLVTSCATQQDRGIVEHPDTAEGTATSNIIVSYDVTSAQEARASIAKASEAIGAKILYSLDNLHYVVLALPPATSVEEGIRRLSAVPGVISVRQDQIEHLN